MSTMELPTGDTTYVRAYRPHGTERAFAEVWLATEDAHRRFSERRIIEGRICGRLGSTRAPEGASEEEVEKLRAGEFGLAQMSLRVAAPALDISFPGWEPFV